MGDETKRAGPSQPSTSTPPTMSTIESIAPTSWKCTRSGVVAVDRRLGLGQPPEQRRGLLLDGTFERRAVQELDHVAQVPVLRLGSVGHDVDLRRREAGAGDALGVEPVARERQARELVAERLDRKAEVHARSQQHVAGGAARAVEVDHAAHRTPRSLRLT